jgi:hypothetical protein
MIKISDFSIVTSHQHNEIMLIVESCFLREEGIEEMNMNQN